MAKKTVKANLKGVNSLPDDKPVTYKYFNGEGENIYTGSTKKGQVRNRLKAHLPGHDDAIPGAVKVQIEQHLSIDDAKKKEANVISPLKAQVQPEG